MRKQRTFTEEEANTIKALYEEGVGIKAIAKGLHCHPDKVSDYVKCKYGPNSLHAGRKKNPIHRDRDIHLSVDMVLAIESDTKQVEENPVVRIKPVINPNRSTTKPPVGNEWKPWMIPTEILIPEDMSKLNWTEYAKDYDKRKQICDERNAKLKG